MEIHRIEQMRSELDQLFGKQREILKSREFGVASDAEILGIRDQARNHSRNVQ